MSSQPPSAAPLHVRYAGHTLTVQPGDVLTIGRARECTLVLDDVRVSRKHAWLQHDGAGWTLYSQGGNGTFVGGRRVEEHRVTGPVTFLVGDPDGVPVEVSPAVGAASQQRGPGASAQHVAQPSGAFPPSGPMPQRGTAPVGAPQAGPMPGGSVPPRGPRSGPMPQGGPTPFGAAPIETAASEGPASMSIRIDGSMLAGTGAMPAGRAPMPPPPSQQGVPGPGTMPQGRGPAQQGVAVPHSGQGAITIGRGRDNTIVVDDLLVSRHHARVVPDGRGGYQVEDLGSRNGTYVDGARVGQAHLGEGGLLSVGHSQFRVQQGRLVASVDQGNVPFVAANISFVLPSGKKLLDDVSFSVDGATLTAVIGPSGAGKSTILNALTGNRPASSGRVFYDNRDLYENYDDLRHRIGLVPQDDVVHRQLNVRQALSYAAELRFPDDLDKSLREQRIDEVIGELELTKHVDTRIDKLSGGQRKRVSVALELLTRPSLLFLDEPTSGLDPGLDKQVMNLLRNLADGGRTVFVVTHSVANLDVCDRVLLLAPGGKVAYYGPPQEMLSFFGASDHADVFTMVTNDPEGAKQRFGKSPLYGRYIAQEMHKSLPQTGQQPRPLEPSRQQSIPRQLSTLIRRHLKVILADRSYAAFMLIMPLVLAGLALVMPAKIGFLIPSREEMMTTRFDPIVPQQISFLLLVLIIGAAFMGAAASSRELVSERAIWLREKSVGLSPFAYLLGKIVVFLLLSVVQGFILVGTVMLFKRHPQHASLLGNGALEIFVACILTAFVCAIVGLLISSFVSTGEQVMPLLVVFIMIQLVLAGALFPLADNLPLNVVSWFAPARWGFGAAASTVGMNAVAKKDMFWRENWYLLDLVVMFSLGVGMALITLMKLRQKPKR